MDSRKYGLNLQGLLRMAVEQTSSEDTTTESQYTRLDPDRQRFLDAALKHMTVDVIEEFRKSLDILEVETATNEEKLQALNNIRDFVDNLDFANSFIKIGGSQILLKYIQSPEKDQKVVAIYCIAEMSQNNPFAQKHYTEAGAIPILIENFKENEDVASCSIHAVSAIIRTFPPGLIEFLKHGGINALLNTLNSTNSRVFIKSVFLIACLTAESEDVKMEFVKKGAIEKLWQFVEQPIDGFDVKIETVLNALSELTKSNSWKPAEDLSKTMQKLLNEIIKTNEKLPQSEETVAYARQVLENLTNPQVRISQTPPTMLAIKNS